MNKFLGGLFFMVVIVSATIGLSAQLPQVEQVWPAEGSSITLDGPHSWVAVNPYAPNIFVYAYGKLWKGVKQQEQWTWRQIGKGLPANATFEGVDDLYASPLSFSKNSVQDYGVTGYLMLLGNNSLGGVPYQSDDGGETWHPINICEKGPGHSNLTFKYNGLNVGVFSGGDPHLLYFSGYGAGGAQPVFIGARNPTTGVVSMLHDPLFPTIDPNCVNCPSCMQSNDNPYYASGDPRLGIIPQTDSMFENDWHVIYPDLQDEIPAHHANTKYKAFNTQFQMLCTTDNVFMEPVEGKTTEPWHFTAPVFSYKNEGSVIHYTLCSKLIRFTTSTSHIETVELDPPIPAYCETEDEYGRWIFKKIPQAELPSGQDTGIYYKMPARQITRLGDKIFFLMGSSDINEPSRNNYISGNILSFSFDPPTWTKYGNDRTTHFSCMDLGDGQYDIFYLDYSENDNVKLKVLHTQTSQTNEIRTFKDTSTQQLGFTITNGQPEMFPTPTFVYADDTTTKKMGFNDVRIEFNGHQFNYYDNNTHPLCTATFTAIATKNVAGPPGQLWAYLASDAGIWRNKEFKSVDSATVLNAFEHISGGYGPDTAGQIPATGFGNYCYKAVIKPDSSPTELYAACKSGLWHGIEASDGGPVAWTLAFAPSILEGVDAGVKDVIIVGGYIFIVTGNGLYRSMNDGSWKEIYLATPNNPVTVIAPFPNTSAPFKIAWAVGSSLYDPAGMGSLNLYTFNGEEGNCQVLMDGIPTADIPVKEIQCLNEDGCDVIYYLTNKGILNRVSTNASCQTITISPSVLPNGMGGGNYAQEISAFGGNGPYKFILVEGRLPLGLAISDSGLLSGEPKEAGTFSFRVRATDANCCVGFIEYSLNIHIKITPDSLPAGFTGQPYSCTISALPASAYTYVIIEGILPAGLVFENGKFSGTPIQTGDYDLSIAATDSNGRSVSTNYHLLISQCPMMTFGPPTLPPAVIGDPYDQLINVYGGIPPYTIALPGGGLPRGLCIWLKDDGWHLTGNTFAYEDAGNYDFTMSAVDAKGCVISRQYQLQVRPVTIASKTVELVCENNFAHLVLRIKGANLSAKELKFSTYFPQSDGTEIVKADYETLRPISVSDSEILLGLLPEWNGARVIEITMGKYISDILPLSSSPFTPFSTSPNGGSIGGGYPVTIHGMDFTESTAVSFYINGSWVNQNAAYLTPGTITIAATTPGPTCEGPVDMKIAYPSGCELVVPSAYTYGYQGTLYTDHLSGAVAGFRQLRFFACPDCPKRSPSDCPASFSDGDIASMSKLEYTFYSSLGSSNPQSGNLYDTAYVSPTEMTAKLPVIPSLGYSTFGASNLQDCPGAITTPSSIHCVYKYQNYNEGLATGGTDSNTKGFLTPIDTDGNMQLSWPAGPNGNRVPENNYFSSVSVFPYMGWNVSTSRNLGLVTPYPNSWYDNLPLAYVVDVSGQKVIDTDNNPGNGITGIKMPELYGIKYPLKSQVYIPNGSWSMYGLVIGTGPSRLPMSPTAKPILNIIDLDSSSPTRYSVINKYIGSDSIATDIALAVIPVEDNTDKTYAFISEFIYHSGPRPPECPPCIQDDGRPIPTPSGYRPGLLILDVSIPKNIHKVKEYVIEGNAGDGFENFALTLAKNSNDIYEDANGNTAPMPYIYLVAPGANKVMVYSIGENGGTMDFVKDGEGNIMTYDVGETPSDLAWVHYEFPRYSNNWYDKVYVTSLNQSQIQDYGPHHYNLACDPVFELNVQNFSQNPKSHSTDLGYPLNCDPGDIPMPTAIDFRVDGQWGYVVQGYGGSRQNGGVINVFDPSDPDNPAKWGIITLAPETNPTRFDVGAYVDYQGILRDIEYNIIELPTNYFDVPDHQQTLLNQTKAIRKLLPTKVSNTALISKLSAMEGDVNRWVVHKESRETLLLQLNTEKTFVLAQRKVK